MPSSGSHTTGSSVVRLAYHRKQRYHKSHRQVERLHPAIANGMDDIALSTESTVTCNVFDGSAAPRYWFHAPLRSRPPFAVTASAYGGWRRLSALSFCRTFPGGAALPR